MTGAFATVWVIWQLAKPLFVWFGVASVGVGVGGYAIGRLSGKRTALRQEQEVREQSEVEAVRSKVVLTEEDVVKLFLFLAAVGATTEEVGKFIRFLAARIDSKD